METKKISFGFSKLAKKPIILPSKVPREESKVELIKCLEGKEIKLVAERQEAAPLVIQMLTQQKTSTALASLMKRRAVLLGEDEPDPEEDSAAVAQTVAEVTANGNSVSLEERAARELIAAAEANGSELAEGEKLVLPALKADELPLDGAKEATLDDYDSIPIQQFGLAMLRGMGWVDPPPVSKKKAAALVEEAPFLRPKGMGLGADKAIKRNELLVQPEKNEVLEIKKQAYVRILGGKQKDQYGQIEGFDDHAGRVIVKMAIGGAKEAFNEFLCQPISRKEYAQFGKCINTAKYEEFKKQENEHGQIVVKRQPSRERTSVKTERRDRQYEEEHKSYRTKDEDRKPYKTESRSAKLEERREYKEERSTNKEQERKPQKLEQRSAKLEERRTENREYREERSAKLEERRTESREFREERSFKLEERRTESREYREERSAKLDERRTESREHRERSKQEERKPYTTEERRKDADAHESRSSSRFNARDQDSLRSNSTSKSSSSRRRQQQSSCDEAEDTGDSTESDSDSAYERKHKKKSKSGSSKSKKKKSKKSKSKSHRHRRSSSSGEDSDGSADEPMQRQRHQSKHKKKTKKSKHARSRTRSRSREGR